MGLVVALVVDMGEDNLKTQSDMTRKEAKHILAGYVKACQEEDTFTLVSSFNYKEVLEAMRMGADALSEPSLPSNLDEASKKIVIQLHPCMEYNSVLGDHLTMGELVELVKAGANWQKEQDESRRIANIQLANTDTPVDSEMEVAFNDIWRDAEVIVERDGTLDEKATELMKAVCHDFFESGKEWQKE